MKREDINIRDPYVLVYDGKYYLYGTRSETCWGEAYGFDCYVGKSLDDFEGPFEIFSRPEGFFADRFYWAPECYFHNDFFYLVTTLGNEKDHKGIYVLRSDSPKGPFVPYSGRLTPKEWCCIDGTLYFEDGKPYLIFSHSFEDGTRDGDYCLMELKPDLCGASSEPVTLFAAKDTSWAKPVPFAKEEFGIDGEVYFSDGPGLVKTESGRLYMILSSWSDKGYAVGVACSGSGKVRGPWILQDTPLYPGNGGHGMLFNDLDGNLIFTLHSPNDKYMERPVFFKVEETDGRLMLLKDSV